MTTNRSTIALTLMVLVISSATGLLGQSKNIAERLGYRRDAKLLIIHADDLAVAHSEDIASLDAHDTRFDNDATLACCPPPPCQHNAVGMAAAGTAARKQ